MIKKYVETFNKVLSRKEFNYTGTQIAQWSGLGLSQVSRFMNDKTDLPVSKFFQLLNSMPPRFQQCYWAELLGLERKEKDWHSLIVSASVSDIQTILQALSEWTVSNSNLSLG
jgi:hypothetical protein